MGAASSRRLSRRDLLAGFSALASLAGRAGATEIRGLPAWDARAGAPPDIVQPGPWKFFTAEEGAAVEALVDRLIPPDPQWTGGKGAGCAVFIDRQLAGAYGESRGLYMRPPFHDGDPQQGPQSPMTPAVRYRRSLEALDKHCQGAFVGKRFAELTDEQKDEVITGLEHGGVKLQNASGRGFFELLVQNTQEGFFADPVYGGNRDMVGWKMIGFPGARYDYRDWIERHNEKYPRPPVGIAGRPEWVVKRS